MITLRSVLNQFGEFTLLKIDLRGNILKCKFNNTQYKIKKVKNIKEIFGQREQRQLTHDIKYPYTLDSLLKTNEPFGNQVVKINTSQIKNETRYVLINYSKKFQKTGDLDEVKYIETLRKESELDQLTQTLNRRGGWRKIEQILNTKGIKSLGIIFVDIDGLKQINDKKGHIYGDKAILQISKLLKDVVRKKDIVMRFGGDEFVIVVDESNTNRSASRGIAKRILRQVKSSKYLTTVSVGIHLVNVKKLLKKSKTEEDLERNWEKEFELADQAVYQAKKAGKATYTTTEAFDKSFNSK